MVLNKTKVLKARLFAKSAKGREFELLLLSPLAASPCTWNALVKPGRYIEQDGTRLTFADGTQALVRRSLAEDRQFEVQFPHVDAESFHTWVDSIGTVPLPPYMKRSADEADAQNYQTVYAERWGSVAAPTAGLHFTPGLIRTLQAAGVQFESLTLHIGYGTFSPIDPAADHLHSEPYAIEPTTAARLEKARSERRRVIAVGTTVLRALESAREGALSGNTTLFIRPGYVFSQVDGLITNFHLPRSSLFVLLCAFMGRENALAAYREAVEKKYRFYSYGDAMAVL